MDDKEVLECGFEDMGGLEVLDEGRGGELAAEEKVDEIVEKQGLELHNFVQMRVLVQSHERYEKKKKTDTGR